MHWNAPREPNMFFKGQCRIAAPKTYQIGGAGYELSSETVWPMTQETDWCGEFKERSE